jgi:hypothetical protein
MPNSYYNNDNAPQNATKANAQNEDADRDALEAAFDLLPSPTDIARGELNYQGTDTGAVNAYAVNITRITALGNGQRVTFVPANTNTAASTLNVSGLGSSAILGLDGLPLVAGEIVSARPVTVIRQGTSWFLQNTALNSKASVTAAATSAAEAAASALAADASADAAASVTNVVSWVSGTLYVQGTSVYSPMDFQTYRRKTTGAGATDPSLDAVKWAIISGGPRLPVSRRDSLSTLVNGDRGTLIEVGGGGSTTQTFDKAVDLGPDWYVFLSNTDTVPQVILAAAGETVDGLSGYPMYPGEMRMYFPNAPGTGVESKVINAFEVTFDSSGTFTKPPGYLAFEGFAWSAGASGAKNATDARGGHGGGCFPFNLAASVFGAAETVIIGAGGAASSGPSQSGGDTSIGSLFTVKGASETEGGAIGYPNRVVFVGASDNALTTTLGGATQQTSHVSTVYGGATAGTGVRASGRSIYGGAAGGSYFTSGIGAGGPSLYGGDGGEPGDATSGTDGQQPGGGGGATRTGTTSGKGGDGRVVIRGIF